MDDPRWILILIFVSYLNTVSLQPKVVYKPTEYPYSRCFEHGTDRVTCEKLNMSKERLEKQSVWPPGPYALLPTKYGCPESQSRGWLKIFNWEDRGIVSYCLKFRNDSTLDQGQWIPGNYSIFKVGPSCPTDFEESSIISMYARDFMLGGHVPNFVVAKDEIKELINISTCKRRNFTDMGNIHTSVTFKMLETDFVVIKDPAMNCSNFDVSTVYKEMHYSVADYCLYSPKHAKVVNFDYELATELILNPYEQNLYKLHEDTHWYALDCQRLLEVVMIELNTSFNQTTAFTCYVSDVPQILKWDMFDCNIDSITKQRIPGKIFLRRTRGRFFLFDLDEIIYGVVSYKIFISSIDAQNGEPCFESIYIQEAQVSGSYIRYVPMNQIYYAMHPYETISWVHDLTDLTPWILVDLISLTTIEGLGVYFSRDCDRWTSFSLYFGTDKNHLKEYQDTEFRIFPEAYSSDQTFFFHRPFEARYVKINDSLASPTHKPRCFSFMLYGCKFTSTIDLTSSSLSDMLPLDQELRSGNSSFINNTSVEECKQLCKSKKSCSVASINEERLCYHYVGSELGIWKHSKITNGSQWFAKLQNNELVVSFPRAYQNESFLRNVQYIDGASIITSLNYPLTAHYDYDILWIVNFVPGRFAKFVFTNVSLSESELIVKTSEDGNKGFSIDTQYNDKVFVLETDKSLIFLSSMSKTTRLPPKIQFRAIVTAEDSPACFSLDLNGLSDIRQELCNKPSMFLTSLSYLNHPLKWEEFAIQAGQHQNIDITFIDFCIACFRYTRLGELRSYFWIEDLGENVEICSTYQPPQVYKSKGSKIHLYYKPVRDPTIIYFGKRVENIEGFRLQFQISEHAFEKYTTEVKEIDSAYLAACARFFKKCYSIFSEKVSWNNASNKCRERNEHLVTITSKKEMAYIQDLLRSQLYKQRAILKHGVNEQINPGAIIGLRRRRTSFYWINDLNVTFSAWGSGQPAPGDCTYMTFEIFNTEKLWSTVDCFDDLVDFFICEKPFSEERFHPKTEENECTSVFRKEKFIALPYSGKTCKNWGNLSGEAKVDFEKKFSSLRTSLNDSILCIDIPSNGIHWCYVNDQGKSLREPCFLFLNDKGNTIFPEKGLYSMKCSDGSSIPKVNWCDRNFDCLDYTDELSCLNDITDHSLTNTGKTMINTHLPDRLKYGAFFRCEHSKEWISKLAECDDVIDCLDASDEIRCLRNNSACGDSKVSCDDGHCIHQNQVCDFITDCTDGTDEICDYRMCDISEFRCKNGQCIPAGNRCNAVYDCYDNSDEIRCDSCQNSFLCVDDYKCIPDRLTCDNYPDCRDKSDEQNCIGLIPTTDVFNIEYLSVKLFDQSCTWDFVQEGNQSGRITYSKQCLFQLDSAYFLSGFNESYSCFVEVRKDCKFRFREAALIDNNNSDFAFPSCHCTIGTFRKGKPLTEYCYAYHELNIDSVTGCDGSKMAELHIPDENSVYNYIQNTSDIATFIWPKDFSDMDMTVGRPYCIYDYNASVFGDWFKCERDNKFIPESMVCIYSVDVNGYMTGCRSGDHLQNCEKFICPENTVKCPGSYCIEQRFLCDGHIECPGGEDEQDCTCKDSEREVILFVEDGDPASGQTAIHLAKQLFTSAKYSLVRLLYFKSLNISMDFDITFRLLEIREERLNQLRKTECKYKTMARDFLKKLHFTKSEKRGIIVLENSYESAVVSSLVLSNLSQPEFSIYRVIKDLSSSLYKNDEYKFVKDIHISKWKSLYWTGFRRFPEICTEAYYVPCAGKFRCSSSKQCIPFDQVCDFVVHCRNGDDERLCNSVCPPKCNCVNDVIINCRAANISVSDLSSLAKYVRSADLSKNPTIKEIHESHLNFPYMLRLNISSGGIHHIDNTTFFNLKELLLLDLSNNRIQQLPVVFSKLRYLNISSCDIRHLDNNSFVNLQYLFLLDLSGNKIRLLPDKVFSLLRNLTHLNLDRNFELTKISPTAFNDLKSLKHMKITGTSLKKISSLTFSDLNLNSLDVSNNQIEEIENDAFNNSQIGKINFEGNNVIKFGKQMFNGVTFVRQLHTPAFKFCCIRPCYVPEDDCRPLKNEFSSCEDLIRNSVLQAVLWIVGIASLFGNLSSIIYRLVFDRKRLKIGYGIFVTNLAVADFLMGVYLIMIAVADSFYRNRYTFVDEYWRNSKWCVTAGILSTVSSEASVFFLCFITLDRLLVIKFPFGTVRFRPAKAYICCGICWFISITLSIIPILYTSHFKNQFYSKTGVCIALPLTRDKPPGWMYSVSIFVGLNFCTFILVAVGQLAIFKELRRASVMKKTQQSRKRDLKVARNLILVATTDFLCWFPIGVMGILSIIGCAIPSDVYAWTAIFVLPINSALNPFLYTLSAILGKKSFNPSIDEQSRTMVQKEIGNAILKYQKFSRSVRMKQDVVPVGTMRSIQEILNDDRCSPVSIVAVVSKQLAEYLCLLHESFIVIDELCETNVYITKVKQLIVVIDAKHSIAADERALHENICQYGKLIRTLVSKCDTNIE